MADLTLEEGVTVLTGRAKAAGIGILAFTAIFTLTILCDLAQIGGLFSLDQPGPLVLPAAAIYLFSSVIYLASVVVVSLWIYRAHANLYAAGFDGLEYTPGWSVGWFFVPVANLFKPFQAMRELWNASHQQEDAFPSEPDRRLKLWWGMWIAGNALGNLSGKSFLQSGETGLSAGLVVDLAAFAIMIVAAWLLLQIIEAITRAQRSMMGLAQTFA